MAFHIVATVSEAGAPIAAARRRNYTGNDAHRAHTYLARNCLQPAEQIPKIICQVSR